MRSLLRFFCTLVAAVGMASSMIGVRALAQSDQTQPTANATPSDHGVKSDVKRAGRATKRATKKTARKVKRATRKGTHKAAKKTRQGAGKVEDRTQGPPPPPPQ